MNISEHEYLLPIVIGNGKDAVSAARKIYKTTGAKAHLFSHRFPVWQRLFCVCHTVDPMRDCFVLDSILSYLRSVEEYYCPVIIVCDEYAQELVDKYSDALESACLVIEYDDFFANDDKGGTRE